MTWFKVGLCFGAGAMTATVGVVSIVMVLGAMSLEVRERKQLRRMLDSVRSREGTD